MIRKAVLSERAEAEFGPALAKAKVDNIAHASPDNVSRLLPPGAVHQGVALLCEPLPALDLEDALAGKPGPRLVAVLDQITDPHNEGAILRSAAAFGVAAVIVQDRHAPPESGALAKAASGGLDLIPRIAVVNIARALEELGRLGFYRIALAADGEAALRDAAPEGRCRHRAGRRRCGVATPGAGALRRDRLHTHGRDDGEPERFKRGGHRLL